MEDFNEKWKKCLEIIRDNVGQDRFDAWFGYAKEVELQDDRIIITLPSHFVFEKYEYAFSGLIVKVLQRVFGRKLRLGYVVKMVQNDPKAAMVIESPDRTPHAGSRFARQTERPVNPLEKKDKSTKLDIDTQLNRTLTFSNYRVGKSNKLPFTIADFIAHNPSKREFNPFFLYGDVGVGKTHLASAIGNHIKEMMPSSTVIFMPMRQFQYLYANARNTGTIPDFIRWFETEVDVLIIDDLQELSFKKGTNEALFPIFNSLHLQNKKLIFTCDRPPMELDGITDRLIDRFKWGVTEKLPKPDFELRKEILHYKAGLNGLSISSDVLDYIAEAVTGSVRELEGVVMGLLTRSITSNCEIDIALAKGVLANCVRTVRTRRINFDMIVEATAEYYNLNPDVLFSKSRVRDIADARQMVMYLAKKHTGLSLPAIGAKLNRKHSTVLHDIRAVSSRLTISDELVATVADIEKDLAL